MIRAVLFDLDGTLLDWDASLLKFIDRQYDRFKPFLCHIPKEVYERRFIELDQRGYVSKDKVYQQLIEEYQIYNLTWEGLLDDYLEEFSHNCVPFPNLIDMLEELQDMPLTLGIITNGPGQFQMSSIQALGIAHYFDVILISEWEGVKKPEPEIFKRALKKLQCLPHECVFIGDHPENDVQGARNVGMKGIWKKDASWPHVEGVLSLDYLAELPKMIKGFKKI